MDHVNLLSRQLATLGQLFPAASNGGLEALLIEEHLKSMGTSLKNLEGVLNPPAPAEEEAPKQLDWIEELQKAK
jgi:hypothetical protein